VCGVIKNEIYKQKLEISVREKGGPRFFLKIHNIRYNIIIITIIIIIIIIIILRQDKKSFQSEQIFKVEKKRQR
jgi:hypothetical protein